MANRSVSRYLLLSLAILVTAVVLVIELSSTQPQRLRITSGSMRPTLAVGQVVRLDGADRTPRVGEIVAFRAPVGATSENPICGVERPSGEVCPQPTPERSDQIFVKRVVAGPGDTIAILGGHVVLNGQVEGESFTAPCGASQECNYPVSVTIPAGEWFLLGDDRGASDDSRNWGPVPTAWILGRVMH